MFFRTKSAAANKSPSSRLSPPSKTELLNWVGSMLALDTRRMEEFASGAIFCQMIDAYFPQAVPVHRVNFQAQKEYEFMSNYKILQSALTTVGVTREIDVQKLMRGSPVKCLELLQFLYVFLRDAEVIEGYNPSERRSKSAKQGTNRIPMPSWMNHHFDVYGQPKANKYAYKLSCDGSVIAKWRSRSISTSGFSRSSTSQCIPLRSREKTASVDSCSRTPVIGILQECREGDGSSHQPDRTSPESQDSRPQLEGASRSRSQSTQRHSGHNQHAHNSTPLSTAFSNSGTFIELEDASSSSSSADSETWNADTPYGSRNRLLRALETLKPGSVLADDYIIEVGQIAGKPRLRLAKHKYRTQERVVLKFYWDKDQLKNTLDVHSELCHSEQICRIIQSLRTPRTGYPPCIVFEKGSQTLEDWIKYERPLVDRMWCLYQVLVGIKEMHDGGIVHCDIKPSNIIFFADSVKWKLADLDGAKKAETEIAASLTPAYAAPEAVREYIESKELSTAHRSLDLWSFGVVAYEVLSGKRFFQGDVTVDAICDQLYSGRAEQNLAQISDDLQKDAVSSLLRMKPRERIPAAQILQHAIFQSTSNTTTAM